ncbi:hypothetical protein Tsubulata_033619 [Turnera subulata]|uniref:CCHC-type domain-containing protein n=1 Tax=Turnera subulata TaxID=218843 RepID=A0A9Q0F5Q2_9ROSI|nr:hypothetical protein Tsubulata_033619 [Turnera subulata]
MASVSYSGGGGIVGREMTAVWESSKEFSPAAATSVSPPSTPPPPPRQRVSDKDTCFSCKRQGHWAADCPAKKSPKNSRASSPGSSGSEPSPPLPVVQCPCGGGSCSIVVSRTDKNPDRKYFACPDRRRPEGCGFFKWCDDVRAPPCPCEAGLCSYNKDPPSGRWYFACRIPKVVSLEGLLGV